MRNEATVSITDEDGDSFLIIMGEVALKNYCDVPTMKAAMMIMIIHSSSLEYNYIMRYLFILRH